MIIKPCEEFFPNRRENITPAIHEPEKYRSEVESTNERMLARMSKKHFD